MGAQLSIMDSKAFEQARLYFEDTERKLSGRMLDFVEALKSKAWHEYLDRCKQTGEEIDGKGIDHWAGLGVAYPEEMFPKRVTLKKDVRVPDYHKINGAQLVSQAFRDVVESFDKDIHQFIPVNIDMADGTAYKGDAFYIFNNGQVLNSIDDTGLKVVQKAPSIPVELRGVSIGLGTPPYSLLKEKIAGAGIWREIRNNFSDYVSDAFIAELKAKGLDGWYADFPFNEI